jgi:predicted Fe-Mo cluster-binding NifX family protein
MKMETKTTTTIAVASDDTLGLNGRVAGHFGSCPTWVLAQVDGEQILDHRVVANPGHGQHGCGPVVEFLAREGVRAVLVGGMGRNAAAHLARRGIEAVPGFQGGVAACLGAFLRGRRPPSELCRHEGHGHGHGSGCAH